MVHSTNLAFVKDKQIVEINPVNYWSILSAVIAALVR